MFTGAWLHVFDHKMVGFYHCHHKSQFIPSSLQETCCECSSLLWQNTRLPCQPLWLLPYPDGLGVSHQGPWPSGFCMGLLYHPSHRFLPPCRPIPWLRLFHYHGIPRLSMLEQAPLELPATWHGSCQSCYFRELDEERENVHYVCVRMCMCVREIQCFLSTSQHSWGF